MSPVTRLVGTSVLQLYSLLCNLECRGDGMAVIMEALKTSFLQRVELFRSRPFKTLLPTACTVGRKPSARIESSVRSNDATIVNGQSVPRIQQLYHACESAFKRGNTTSEESLATIRSILGAYTQEVLFVFALENSLFKPVHQCHSAHLLVVCWCVAFLLRFRNCACSSQES